MKKSARATARKSTDIAVRLSPQELSNICELLASPIEGVLMMPAGRRTPAFVLATWKAQREDFIDEQIRQDARRPRWPSGDLPRPRSAHEALRDQNDRDAATLERLLSLMPAK